MKKYQLISKKDGTNIHYFDTIEQLRDALATNPVSELKGYEIVHLTHGENIENDIYKVNVI